MKSLFTFICSLLILSSSAQSLSVVNGANWQQYISTILGGNCVTISNVQYNTYQQASGYFINGNNPIGLNKGIVMTTGLVNGISDFTSFSLSSSNFYNGDSLLSAVAGSTSYDANIIEFDFEASVSDTVWIKYVFASEEYPEYAPPNNNGFNDVFGFFVSGGGYNNYNIAKIPGSNLPVSINNINAITNNQYYISAINNIAYDAYTVPLLAKFYAEAGQTYHLKIAIADVGDSSLDSAVFLESFGLGSQQISGSANINGLPINSGLVQLFGLNTDSTQANLIGNINLSNGGNFSYINQLAGSYILRVIPNATIYPGSMPKYYNNAYTWASADIITLPCSIYEINLSLAPQTNGSGSVSGTIYSTTSNLRTTADFDNFTTRNNTDVFLYRISDQEFIKHFKTSSNGKYEFSTLDSDNYQILVDVPGLGMASVHDFSIQNEQSITNLNYIVGKNKIEKYEIINTVKNINKDFKVFPNPFTNQINLTLPMSGNFQFQLFDMSGRLVHTEQHLVTQNELVPLALSSVQKGTYILQAFDARNTFKIKLIK